DRLANQAAGDPHRQPRSGHHPGVSVSILRAGGLFLLVPDPPRRQRFGPRLGRSGSARRALGFPSGGWVGVGVVRLGPRRRGWRRFRWRLFRRWRLVGRRRRIGELVMRPGATQRLAAAVALWLGVLSAMAFAFDFPTLTGPVVDQAGVMSADSRNEV